MNYSKTLEYIHSLGNFSKAPSLERIKEVLKKLNSPQRDLKVFHIAGTNGKGSVSTYISSVLRCAGFKTGLFVSPFITDFRERISINGEFIPENDIVLISEKIIDCNVSLNEFEFITALGLYWFNQNKVDYAVIEVGLGGRLDATNVFDNSIPVITHIGLDHTKILGPTVEKIAAEKCGIIKNNLAVVSPYQEQGVMDVIKTFAENVIVPDIKDLKNVKISLSSNSFTYKNIDYASRLSGNYQIENALTAISALEVSGIKLETSVIQKGINEAYIPARLETVSFNPTVILDGAHNPLAAKALGEFIKNQDKKVFAVVAMMKDKDTKGTLKEVLPLCDGCVVTEVPGLDRSVSAETLCSTASQFCDYVYCVKDALKALETAKKLTNGIVLVFGSLYLASFYKNN